MIVNLPAGSLLGAWLGATWATRMASDTLYRVIVALLVLIAASRRIAIRRERMWNVRLD